MFHHRILALRWVLLAALCAGCLASRTAPAPLRVDARYLQAFDAVEAALAREELDLAERTLALWRARLVVDRAAAQRARASAGDSVGAATPLPLTAVEDAERMVERLELVLAGRRTVAALALRLELRRVPGREELDVVLAVASSLAVPVQLDPGPVNLQVERWSIDPRTAHETLPVEVLALGDVRRLAIPAGGEAEVRLATIPIEVPAGSIATRTRCAAQLRSGQIEREGRRLPLRPLRLPDAERTELPAWVPAGPVEPAELARLVALPTASRAALIERAVRVLPERRAEALDALREPALARTPEEFEALVPVLRWLTGTRNLERDVAGWRALLQEARG